MNLVIKNLGSNIVTPEHRTSATNIIFTWKMINHHDYGKCSKISKNQKRKNILNFFLSSPVKQREVTNFAKGDNLIAPLQNWLLPSQEFCNFPFKINILLYKFLEDLLNTRQSMAKRTI